MTSQDIDSIASPKSTSRVSAGIQGMIRQDISMPSETLNSNPASMSSDFRGGNDIIMQDFDE